MVMKSDKVVDDNHMILPYAPEDSVLLAMMDRAEALITRRNTVYPVRSDTFPEIRQVKDLEAILLRNPKRHICELGKYGLLLVIEHEVVRWRRPNNYTKTRNVLRNQRAHSIHFVEELYELLI